MGKRLRTRSPLYHPMKRPSKSGAAPSRPEARAWPVTNLTGKHKSMRKGLDDMRRSATLALMLAAPSLLFCGPARRPFLEIFCAVVAGGRLVVATGTYVTATPLAPFTSPSIHGVVGGGVAQPLCPHLFLHLHRAAPAAMHAAPLFLFRRPARPPSLGVDIAIKLRLWVLGLGSLCFDNFCLNGLRSGVAQIAAPLRMSATPVFLSGGPRVKISEGGVAIEERGGRGEGDRGAAHGPRNKEERGGDEGGDRKNACDDAEEGAGTADGGDQQRLGNYARRVHADVVVGGLHIQADLALAMREMRHL
mmetsp:Transcript_22531/g.64879  ORF Transcript_22531/g.64879 Transcript_22531/m.64879 type:complete len:305 (+) Transcript_22531:57-971(+)